LVQLFNRLGLARIAAMAVVAVLMLGFFAFLIVRASSPQMAPLYTGLSFEDSAAIVSELQSGNVAYELRGEGDTILVPRDQITAVRMSLAEDGLPTRGQVGYEIFDEQSALGATSFVQNINNVRALEGELARTISSLARIKSARVHLVLPERELFRRERKDPTASIVLAVRGELSAGEIRAIQHLVASAIEGLTPGRVSIVDDSGRLLASGAGGSDEAVLAGEIEERTLGIENRLRRRVEELLENIVGAGRARVQVSAELDLSRMTRTSETFDPASQVIRSTQTREIENAATTPGSGGEVSVSGELPGAGAAGNGMRAESGTTAEETTNYEISKTTQTEMTEAGAIKRVSVAVVVDGIYADAGSGSAVYTPRSPEELARIAALVRSAVGFQEARGDIVEVQNLQFAERPELAALGTGGEAGLFQFTRDDLMAGAEMIVTLLIALALVLFVMRPLLRKVLAPEQTLALPASAEVGATAVGPSALALPPDLNEPDLTRQPRTPDWIDDARNLGEAQAHTLKTVGELVGEHPKQAAVIVRDWLSSAA
jgi:flagellar M-ring protein FliF